MSETRSSEANAAMRYVKPFVAAALVVTCVSACSVRQVVPVSSPQPQPSQTPTVTLTEPAGGPTRDR
ncbi:hypothetical protein AB8O38_09080 [Saccharomonospora xinjiangensis]|uniref:hypothetical protein n=1 Tax=Saccharomonospora xinjiangensis TaxID=75294 RepID=UPI003510CD43